jgi:hypothetical protein
MRVRTGEELWVAEALKDVPDPMEAFTRAFGHPPSTPAERHWLPAPNGIHFHPPTSLWVHTLEQAMNPVTEQLVEHDLDDTRHLIELAKGLSENEFRRDRIPGARATSWEGEDSSLAAVLGHQVFTKEVWLAAIDGEEFPPDIDGVGAATWADERDALGHSHSHHVDSRSGPLVLSLRFRAAERLCRGGGVSLWGAQRRTFGRRRAVCRATGGICGGSDRTPAAGLSMVSEWGSDCRRDAKPFAAAGATV